jgi:esterase/lipase
MLPVLRPRLLRPRLSRQILEACRLDSKLVQIGLEFSMRVKEFAWVAQRVGLEHRKKESNISVRESGGRMVQKFIVLLVSALMLSASAHSEAIGVVMMHGKHGTPSQLQQLAATVANAGFLVERPEMCWSATRIYDQTYLECFADIDAAATRLKSHGATAIVVLGMSLGGNAALGFGARRQDLKAIIALAPAHAPELLRRRPDIAQSIATAQAAVVTGKLDEKETFNDIDLGTIFPVNTTPVIYLSFFGPESLAVMPDNAAHLTAPVLMVSGSNDPTQSNAGNFFARAPFDPRNEHVTVEADHLSTPAASAAAVLSWLKMLAHSGLAQ